MSRRRSSPYRRYGSLALVTALALLLVVMVLIGTSWYVSLLIALSIVTFLLYGLDKRRAQSGGERVPELVLHGSALAGGVVGGGVGRSVFHHKTRKAVFLVVLMVATALHGAIVWFLYLR